MVWNLSAFDAGKETEKDKKGMIADDDVLFIAHAVGSSSWSQKPDEETEPS